MLFTFTELKQKEIVDTNTGTILGRADDLRFDAASSNIDSLIIYGRPKLFGFLGREGDLSVKFENISLIGKDAVLVTSAEEIPVETPKRRLIKDEKAAREEENAEKF